MFSCFFGNTKTIDDKDVIRETNVVFKKIVGIINPDLHENPDAIRHIIIWIASLSIAVILALSGVIVYDAISDDITRNARETAVNLCGALLEQQEKTIIRLADDTETGMHDRGDSASLDRYFRDFLLNFKILKVKIYNSRKKIVYSTDQTIIGTIDSNNSRLDGVLRGNIDSHLEKKDNMLDLAKEKKFNVEVVETYVPIRVKNRITGSFEIYTDVTSYRREISLVVIKTVTSLALILVFVFACAYLLIRKATIILKETQQELARRVNELEDALANTRQLEGIIPICAYCKNIRDDKESWQQLENYISSHSEARFSHGICPECYKAQLKELEEWQKLHKDG